MIKRIRHYTIYIFFFSITSFNFNLHAKVIPDFSELADELIPSVVSVSVMISRDVSPNRPVAPQFPPSSPFEDFFRDFFERRGVPAPPPRQRRNETAAGSGFIIDKSGYIVTNNHVIANSVL